MENFGNTGSPDKSDFDLLGWNTGDFGNRLPDTLLPAGSRVFSEGERNLKQAKAKKLNSYKPQFGLQAFPGKPRRRRSRANTPSL
jgi:hypothetical protein